ncbi:MAG: DUF4190 domain-containing protein [Candidatus Omnitrophica bacterium]|nr:DUF4190 domain-containing protein [Candidatus Omnitrophota bacterium]
MENQAPVQMPPQPKTSGLAIASLVCGIVSLCCGLLLGIPAIICGHIALKQINDSADTIGGKGMAIAGLIMGYLSLVLTVILMVTGFIPAFIEGFQEGYRGAQ